MIAALEEKGDIRRILYVEWSAAIGNWLTKTGEWNPVFNTSELFITSRKGIEGGEDDHLKDSKNGEKGEDLDQVDLKVEEVLDAHSELEKWALL